ncbi:MAG: YlxR family protein [Deltaproteobacteria bacterium]|nr:YlxR family protein [Deltaproteobacteria bacterium]
MAVKKPRPKLRRCVVCRKSAEKSGLLRFVAQDGRLVCDERAALPGRGAYVHRTLGCWSKMSEPALWEHVLRLTKGSLSKAVVTEAAHSARNAIEDAAPSVRPASSKVRL